jgi:hypothetical protein
MFRQRGRHQRAALAALLTGLVVASPVAAMTRARSSPAGPANAAQWCALVIQINTKYGLMKNKRYLPANKVPLSAVKGAFDAALKMRSKLLSVTPSSIKKAMTDELTWYTHVKANHYSLKTPLAPLTIAEIRQLGTYQRTKCGITGI